GGLVAAPAVERELHAHHVGLLHGDPEVAAYEVAADLFEVLHGADAHGRSGYPSRRWTPCLPTCPPIASSPQSAPCRAARWPATGRSRAARACRGARGWWRGCCRATRTTRCPGTASCAATGRSLSRRVHGAFVNRSGGCARKAGGWRRAACACRAAMRATWTQRCGAPGPESGDIGGKDHPAARRPAAQASAVIMGARAGAPMFTNLPPVTKALLIANCAVFALQLLLG